jgi:hypothetical protein
MLRLRTHGWPERLPGSIVIRSIMVWKYHHRLRFGVCR